MARLLRYVAIPAMIGGAVGLAVLALVDRSPGHVDGFADAVDRAATAVVNVNTAKIVRDHRHPLCEMPRFRELCESQGATRTRLERSLGSGVVVSEDGYILTNAHVIDAADEILVSFIDGHDTRARVVGVDPETDLAVIKVEASGLRPIRAASSADARVGDLVLAIGNPFGIGQTVSLGIVSATGRDYISPTHSPYDDFIQTDAAVHPGNSGGALIDTQGNLVGINTLIFSQSGASEGIGFAIPSDLAFEVMDQIIEFGRVERGWLGMAFGRTGGSSGPFEVRCVGEGTPAQRAGIRIGDLIARIGERQINDGDDITQQIARARPGSVLEVALLRSGEEITVKARTGIRPPPPQSLCDP